MTIRQILFGAVLAACWMPAIAALGADRPSLITEQFFAPRDDRYDYVSRYDRGVEDANVAANLWHKVLLDLDIQAPPPPLKTSSYHSRFGTPECVYETALTILSELRELGDENYLRGWAVNQDRVFAVCDRRAAHDAAPEPFAGETLPDRAKSDIRYQIASWNFYSGNMEQALALYEGVAENRSAPLRPYAAYMVARTLAHLHQMNRAYWTINEILADPALASVHNMAANFRFVLMYPGFGPYGRPDATVATLHLEQMIKLIETRPERAGDIDLAMQNYFDAWQHADWYFPVFDSQTKRVDWWLSDDEPIGPKMRAVKSLASVDETVDWMQSSWTFNIFDADWLWALHRNDLTYWDENRTVVQHAWARWKTGDGIEWLGIVLDRVHPGDDLVADVLREADTFLLQPWKQETGEYRSWLFGVWKNSIRIRLGQGEITGALKLLSDHREFAELSEGSAYPYNPHFLQKRVVVQVLRWLVYVGAWDKARQVLPILGETNYRDFTNWKVLLATDWNQVVAAAEGMRYFGQPSALWMKIMNVLPARELYDVAAGGTLQEDLLQSMTEAILTRAMLLQDNTNIERYGLLAASAHPDYRQEILSAVDLKSSEAYARFLLHSPRFRPVPFTTDYATATFRFERRNTAIDVFNHNDNNWWCAVDFDRLQDEIFAEARVVPRRLPYQLRDADDLQMDEEVAIYLTRQKEALRRHPYFARIDMDEMAALESFPSGPKFLSETVIENEKWNVFAFWRDALARSRSAEDLHLAVRTTRYGCQRDGSHSAYSRKAFKILHDSYGETVWAEATPYWFGDSHFRSN